MFKSFSFSSLKPKSVGKSAVNQRISLQIVLRILALETNLQQKDIHKQKYKFIGTKMMFKFIFYYKKKFTFYKGLHFVRGST
jgi:hypothetical protein